MTVIDSIDTLANLTKALERKNKNSLVYVAETLEITPHHQHAPAASRFTKFQWAQRLTTWVS